MKKIMIGRFIDPLTDFGFKLLFGSEPHKDLLIDFLNQVLKGRKQIVTLEYNKNEQPGYIKDSRKIVYDLRCTGHNGEQFIIEVQKVQQDYFIDRSIYYTSALIHEQGPKGGNKAWNYELPEVYMIGLMDFTFDSGNKHKYIHDVVLMERETKAVFYDKLGYTFIEIPKFNKTLDELESELDKWLYVLKNLNKFDKIPLILDKRIFSILFKIAETANLTKEDHTMYEASLMQKWDYQNGIDFAVRTAVEKTEKKERAAAHKAAQKEKEFIALNLKMNNVPANIIAQSTGLSIEEIEKL